MVEDFSIEPCSVEERVYHSAKEGEDDFVYLYETMIRDLGVAVPFDDYEADILPAPRVAPTQLHPNGWAAIPVWISLSPFPKMNLFNAYLASYKGFKGYFVKIRALDGTSFHGREAYAPPHKYKGFPHGALSPKEKLHLSFLDELPKGMSCKDLVTLAFNQKPIKLFRVIISGTMRSKNGFGLNS
ncbi:hypothetical protein CR513_16946, partial [Mucuna pruriens]